MGKKKDINKLVTFLSLGLVHRIGSIVNLNEIYSEKYKKASEVFLKNAVKISLRYNWNKIDKVEIRELLKKKVTSSGA